MQNISLTKFENIIETLRFQDIKTFISNKIKEIKFKLYSFENYLIYANSFEEAKLKIADLFDDYRRICYIHKFLNDHFNSSYCTVCNDKNIIYKLNEFKNHYDTHNRNDVNKNISEHQKFNKRMFKPKFIC